MQFKPCRFCKYLFYCSSIVLYLNLFALKAVPAVVFFVLFFNFLNTHSGTQKNLVRWVGVSFNISSFSLETAFKWFNSMMTTHFSLMLKDGKLFCKAYRFVNC